MPVKKKAGRCSKIRANDTNQGPRNVKPGRNDPCPCGSGKKYKHCCSNLSLTSSPVPPAGRELPGEPTANEQNQLVTLYQAGRYAELENQSNLLLKRYPDSGFGWKILS